MKALILLMLPALMLIGCGEMETNEDAAQNYLQRLNESGATTDAEVQSIDESLLDESVQVTQADNPNSIMMKVGGAELLIDFIENLSGDPAETAMIINGIEVTTQIAADPQSFQGLIASLVTSQLEGIDILGVPLSGLVQAGLGLISGDTSKADFSNLFGTLIRGAFNTFLSGTPLGAIFGSLLDPLLGGDAANSGSSNSGSNNNNNNSGDVTNGIVNTIGSVISGGNPLLGGIFSLIMNLFK